MHLFKSNELIKNNILKIFSYRSEVVHQTRQVITEFRKLLFFHFLISISGNTGLHRYVFVLYEQQGKIQFNEKKISNTSIEGRFPFKVEEFAAKYNLNIVACNFYQAQYDSYCDELHKQLGRV